MPTWDPSLSNLLHSSIHSLHRCYWLLFVQHYHHKVGSIKSPLISLRQPYNGPSILALPPGNFLLGPLQQEKCTVATPDQESQLKDVTSKRGFYSGKFQNDYLLESLGSLWLKKLIMQVIRSQRVRLSLSGMESRNCTFNKHSSDPAMRGPQVTL